ncbi:MAG: hypothetical protein ACRENE_00950, partial [Polyangiaceae bacterium]
AVPESVIAAGCRPSVLQPRWLELGGPLPRSVTLATAIAELLAVGAALVFLRSRWRAERALRPHYGGVEKVLLFAGTAIGLCSWTDPFAKLWLDTLNDQRDAIDCLAGGLCSSLGETTSIPGIHHAVSWFHVRALMVLAGLGVDAQLWTFYALDGAAVLLVACAACRLAGRRAGLLVAAGVAVAAYLTIQSKVLNNCIALPCLGALLLVLLTEALSRPGVAPFVLAGFVAALVANVHVSAARAGVSVLSAGALAPVRRLRSMAAGAGTFLVAALAMAPASWVSNAGHAWQRLSGAGHAPGGAAGPGGAVGTWTVLLALSLVAGAALLRHRGPKASLVRAALVLAVPALAVAVAVRLLGAGVTLQSRYVGYAAPGIATLAALAIDGWLPRVFRRRSLVDFALPPAAALCLAGVSTALVEKVGPTGSAPLPGVQAVPPDPTFRDVAGLPAAFEALGWSYAHVYRSLRSPFQAEALKSFEVLAPAYPTGPDGRDPSDAYLLVVSSARLPAPLPGGWTVLREHASNATILVVARTALDWTHFDACDPRAGGQCVPSGLTVADGEKPACPYCVVGLPRAGDPSPIALRLPIRPTPAGIFWSVVMPHGPGVCQGRILDVEGREATLSPDGRRAAWTGRSEDGDGALRVEWDVGSAGCSGSAYRGTPPFFLEGDAETVRLLEDATVGGV